MKPLVLYHANCWDGFCAAWITYHELHEAEIRPVQYGDDPPDVTGREVYIVDFSFPRDTLEKMHEDAAFLVVLDHHKTAEAALQGLDYCIFDMDKSGARLTWEYFYGDDRPHWLVLYTEDRDLWRWEFPKSREVNAAIRSYPLSLEQWDYMGSWDDPPATLIAEGEAILRREKQIVDDHVRNAREVEMAGHTVLIVNATTLFSDIAGELAKGRPFGACYFDRGDGKRQWSLRSREGGVDVSEIAKARGGGGHRQAAGFTEDLP